MIKKALAGAVLSFFLAGCVQGPLVDLSGIQVERKARTPAEQAAYEKEKREKQERDRQEKLRKEQEKRDREERERQEKLRKEQEKKAKEQQKKKDNDD